MAQKSKCDVMTVKGAKALPVGWKVTHLSAIIRDITAGESVNGEDRPANDGELGVLKLNAVSNGRFLPVENKAVLSEDRSRVSVSPREGDVLISRANGSLDLVGATVYIKMDYNTLFLPDLLWRLTTDPSQNNSRWLHYVLSCPAGRRSIESRVVGSNGTHKISQASLRSIEVVRPPIPEQERIVRVLSTWDRAIELTEKLIAAKQKRKQALMQQLLTGKVRFAEFEGKPWSRIRLGKLLTEVKRFVKWDDDAKYHLLSIRRRSGGMFDRETKIGHDIKTKVMMTTEAGDFVIARMQAVHGAISVTPPDFHGKNVSGSYSTFVLKDSRKLHMPFLNYVSQTLAFYRLLLLSAYGVTIEKMTFNLPWFLDEKIDLPPTLDEQKRIADVFVSYDEENRLLGRHLDALKQQKMGLMQQLLTGKLRVTSIDNHQPKEALS